MKHQTIFWLLSIITGSLMCWTCFEGLFSPVYAAETENWKVQSMGQDIINLGLIPLYLLTAGFIRRNKWYVSLLWAGMTIYFIYTYLIYCFDIHFNHLFIFYCLIVCFHFYSLLYLMFLYWYRAIPLQVQSSPLLKQITGIYFVFISLLFYFLWLSEIVPASLHDTVPGSLQSAGLFTNPVQVLDIAFVLPGILFTGILLLRRKVPGTFFAPIVLTFLLLMEITIGGLILILWQSKMESHPGVAWFVFALAAFNLVLVLIHIKQNTSVHASKKMV
ncbi:hypothetical protein [Fluviicola sp.]|uniref:hypothetical protein n=1 Tax=Fluviicola sp. TaxID=1917219 RepID=UPI00260A3866|nr:hypothetical protein [Fluviicola sp.]